MFAHLKKTLYICTTFERKRVLRLEAMEVWVSG